MDYDQLDFDFRHVSSIRLLKSDNAPLIIGFLSQQFKQKHRITVPYTELIERLEVALEALNERQPGLYRSSAQAYLKQWCDDEHGFLRAYTRGASDDLVVELTADTERAISWLEELHQHTFIGTESRFLHIFGLLEDIVQKSTENTEVRLAQLEQQQEALQREIDAIRATGKMAHYTTTQVKERFFQACEVARQLLRDFATVDDNFRKIARSVQEAQLKPDARKGALVGFVLDADAELKSSDQGRSFYAFWEFLMSPTRQDELQELLDAVYTLPALQEVSRATPILRRLTGSLIDAGEKIVSSNHRLAEQLRRILDERAIAESRRVRELITDIKHEALRLIDQPPDSDTIITIEGPPEVQLMMEKELWEPAEPLAFTDQPVSAGSTNLNDIGLYRLYAQVAIDESVLRRQIERVLETAPQITLAGLAEQYPIKKGLAEVIAYLTIASNDERHDIDEAVREQIALAPTAPESDKTTLLTIPQVTFRRSIHAQ